LRSFIIYERNTVRFFMLKINEQLFHVNFGSPCSRSPGPATRSRSLALVSHHHHHQKKPMAGAFVAMNAMVRNIY
jgi:hypothetical protein